MKNFTNFFCLICLLLAGFTSGAQVPKMNSYPSAQATIFLDFDGHTVKSYAWRNDTSFICSPSGLSNTQITEIFNRAAEDFRPFNVTVTTDSTVFLAAPITRRTRMIVTPTSDWYPGVGGVAYIGSFTWGDDTPGFIFSDKLSYNSKNVAEACSHESGHSVGLSHQSRYDANCNLIEQYSSGSGTGEISWAPIMGNSYDRNMTGWNLGPTPYGCVNNQDNLTIITTNNGFTYRVDDFNNTVGTSSYVLANNNFSASGVISKTDDLDAFKFSLTQGGNFHLSVYPYSYNNTNTGANLDVKVDLYNASKTLIRTYNPADILNINIDTTLTAGSYYFVVSGVGNEYAPQYGSLGSYSISGASGTTLPIKSIELTGTQNAGRHQLQWKIISDDLIKEQMVEVSSDGLQFGSLAAASAVQRNYNYTPQQTGNLLYRVKVTSVLGQVMYSNVITLKTNGEIPSFVVSTFVHDNVTVRATEAYNFRLTDANGRILEAGKGQPGVNNIYMNNRPAGMYLLQLISSGRSVTERIVKQ